MKKRILIVLFLIAAIGVTGWFSLHTWWKDNLTEWTWRYKMTVSVETPEGIKIGSAVREVGVIRGLLLLPEMNPAIGVTGEAVVVDLGERGILFALMRNELGSDYAHHVVFNAFPYEGGGTTVEGIHHYSQLKSAKTTLSLRDYPLMVTFKDIRDPRTVEVVYAVEPYWDKREYKYRLREDNFEKLFGKGVRLKDVTIEMTDDPISWGIEEEIEHFGGGVGAYDKSSFIRK